MLISPLARCSSEHTRMASGGRSELFAGVYIAESDCCAVQSPRDNLFATEFTFTNHIYVSASLTQSGQMYQASDTGPNNCNSECRSITSLVTRSLRRPRRRERCRACRRLRTLSIRRCPHLASAGLQPVSNCLALHTVRLHQCCLTRDQVNM